MCRMMASVNRAPDRGAMEEFRSLASNGNVLPGNTCGHGDGWGIAAYEQGVLSFFEKSAKSAVDDDEYEMALDQVTSMDLDVLLCHLRAASKGDVSRENSHPFRHGIYTFCHNGGIRQSEKIPIYDLQPEGQTDSERLFLNIMGRLAKGEAKSLAEAARQAVQFIHENLPYSSITFFITDGRELIVYRDFRNTLRAGEDKPANWEVYNEYYTMYFSPKALTFSSQPLCSLADDWQLMENRQAMKACPDGTVEKQDWR